MSPGSGLHPVPDEPTAGAQSNEHPEATWVESFLDTRPGKTYEVGVKDDAHQAAAREAVESVGRDFTDDIVRRVDLASAADDRATTEPEQT
ncbi:MAG TPA: hypothetical protein VES03_04820 [Motilibacterales bacterium]|nr:hypothetical protein [Motilibacterales bacterium]